MWCHSERLLRGCVGLRNSALCAGDWSRVCAAEPLGRIAEPVGSEGAFLLVEKEKPDGWKVAPPDDAHRIWRRRPGAADDDDLENWTVWLHEADVAGWLTAGGYKIAKWLPEGSEPSWDSE
jgi:hypothetical protein